jgi:tRNA (mo5U34)-methyltransferase
MADLAAEIGRLSWYHTLDLGNGVVTEGVFDHRPVVDRYMIPDELSGMRCLDVGTMDGFWAFEMERRGADEVVAVDVGGPDELDWPPRWRERVTPELDAGKKERFSLVHAALESSVERVERSVYDLDEAALGRFDLVFCSDLLVHLKDPITALQRMLSVCRGSTIICNPVVRFPLSRRPLAIFDGIDEFQWWLLSEPALERMMRAVGFDRVEVGRSFALPARAGGRWKGRRAIMRGFV